jgi:hypothetical protein
MQQVSSAVAAEGPRPSVIRSARRTPRKLHSYFVGFALVFALIVLTGFSRTFFLPMARGTLAKPLIVHLHGAFFFAWTALLAAQAVLAATKRLKVHRSVGSIAGWLVVPMVLLGTIVATRDTVHDFKAGDGDAALSFYYGELADLAMFGLLAGGAMLLRRKPDFHKRWVIPALASSEPRSDAFQRSALSAPTSSWA